MRLSKNDEAMPSSRSAFTPGPSIPTCHTSTIEETPEGLLAAWVGGSRKGAVDTGTATHRESLAVEALEQGAASYVPKSRLSEKLLITVDEVLTVGRKEGAVKQRLGLDRSRASVP